jgi:hypothetical protein
MRLPPSADKWIVLIAGLGLGVYVNLRSPGIDPIDWLVVVPVLALMCMAVYVAWNALCQAVVRLSRKRPEPRRLRAFVNVTFLAFMLFAALWPASQTITVVRIPKRVIIQGTGERDPGLHFHLRVDGA